MKDTVYTKRKEMLLRILLFFVLLICAVLTLVSIWMLDQFGIENIGVSNYVTSSCFQHDIESKMNEVYDNIQFYMNYRTKGNVSDNTTMFSTITLNDKEAKEWSYADCVKNSNVRNYREQEQYWEEQYYVAYGEYYTVDRQEVEAERLFVQVSKEEYIELLKQYGVINSPELRHEMEEKSDGQDEAQADDVADSDDSQQEKKSISGYVDSRFSGDCYIYQSKGDTILYSPYEDIFFSSEYGWFCPPSNLYFKTDDVNLVETESLLLAKFYDRETICSAKSYNRMAVDYAKEQIMDNNSSLKFIIKTSYNNGITWYNGDRTNDIMDMPLYFQYDVKSGEQKTNINNKYITANLNVYKEYFGDSAVVTFGIDPAKEYKDTISNNMKYYNMLMPYQLIIWVSLLVAVAVVLILIISLFSMTGKVSRLSEEIKLTHFDRIPTELSIGIILGLLGITIFYLNYSFAAEDWMVGLLVIPGVIFLYHIIISASLSFVRRVKANILWEHSLCYRVLSRIRYVYSGSNAHKSLTIRNVLIYTLYASSSVFLAIVFAFVMFRGEGALSVLLLIINVVYHVFALLWVLFDGLRMRYIMEGIRKISDGDLQYKLDTTLMTGARLELCKDINNIGNGLEKAIEKSVRDERLKAELITNVSHDIKTPLTSIVNYVDLLKRIDIDNEQAQKYLAVLEQKSQRLKQLTEDLVEASKITTGNIELVCTPLNLGELISQALGEFEEKFQEKSLQIVETRSEARYPVYADGRRTYRIFDNLFQNIYKYSMPGTRVYIEMNRQEDMVQINLKNISAYPLNVSADELTERFIRGDEARTTEGTGLGLSIARSLVELQSGSIQLSVDGDLFKVRILFPLLAEQEPENVEASNVSEEMETLEEEMPAKECDEGTKLQSEEPASF